MKKILTISSLFVSFSSFTQKPFDTLIKVDKNIVDSLSKVHSKKVTGYTRINGKITHFQFIENGKEWELSLVGFRLKTRCTQRPNSSTNRTIHLNS
jgi:ribosomal protein S17E